MSQKIRVLIVDDSMFFRAAIARGLGADSGIEVVGEAFDPYDARDKILALEPDMMTLDVEMPNMSGIEFLGVLLPQWPIPVVVVSSATNRERDARQAGAQDFMAKPTDRSPEGMKNFSAELCRRIHSIYERNRNLRYRRPVPAAAPMAAPAAAGGGSGFIALGASTGGTQATAQILRALPADTPGIVVVQHMPSEFTRMYAENLDRDCAMSIKEARDGDVIERGKVLIAPGGDRQCEVVRRGGQFCVHLYPGEKVSGHCPSVDVLFGSAAKAAGPREAIGVILTGMGADGARGLLKMRQKGHMTIGQDEKSCVVYGMPKEAFMLGAVARQSSLDGIAPLLMVHGKELK